MLHISTICTGIRFHNIFQGFNITIIEDEILPTWGMYVFFAQQFAQKWTNWVLSFRKRLSDPKNENKKVRAFHIWVQIWDSVEDYWKSCQKNPSYPKKIFEIFLVFQKKISLFQKKSFKYSWFSKKKHLVRIFSWAYFLEFFSCRQSREIEARAVAEHKVDYARP